MSKGSFVLGTLGGRVVSGVTALAVYIRAIRPWHRRWGATDAEVAASMPGDDLVTDANFATTRDININVPAKKEIPSVWTL
jgi:hypothetical protein